MNSPRLSLLAAAFGICVALPLEVASAATDTGLATSLHSARREAGKLCLSEHYHTGNGSGSNRAAAEKDAIRSWVGFTAWEYGTAWGSFALAGSRTMNCSNGGSSWSCTAEGRPCRRGR